MIADPLRLFDCTPNTEGASAVVVASRDDARDLRHPPVRILGFVQGSGAETENNTNYNRPDILSIDETHFMRQEMYEKTGLAAKDVDVLQVYDHFTPLVIMGLEGWGFCGKGEGAAFVEGGERISIGGDVALNTAGGHLGEAYVQTMNTSWTRCGSFAGLRRTRCPTPRCRWWPRGSISRAALSCWGRRDDVERG